VFGRRALRDKRTWRFSDGFVQSTAPDKATVFIPKDHPLRIEFRVSLDELLRRQRTPEEMTWLELRERIAVTVEQGVRDSSLSELKTQWHNKLAVPFAALIFALIGAPLGVRGHRSGTSFGLGAAILIVFLYYVLWHYLTVVAERGGLNPLVAAWTPNLIGIAAGIALTVKVSRWGH